MKNELLGKDDLALDQNSVKSNVVKNDSGVDQKLKGGV